MRRFHLAGVSIASTFALIGLASLPATAALADTNSAAMAITDSGFSPTSVSVPIGGSVTWTDNGANVHTATSMGGVQTPFDSGGLSPTQSYGFTFTVPGTYQVVSATDCLNGNSTPGFNCTPATVNVTNTPTSTTTQPAASAAPAASTAPSGTANGTPQQLPSCTYATDANHPDLFCASGSNTATVVVPGNASGGGVVTYTFNYPGDNSNILLTADVSGIDPTKTGAVGASVFDASKTAGPVETDTLQNNQFGGNPDMFRLSYSSGNNGPVTIQLFNWTGTPVTMSVNQSGLVHSDGTMSPVTLQLGTVSPQAA